MILDEKFWLAICFFIFIALIYKPVKKAILLMIDKKIDAIRDELKTAKVMRIEAEELLKKSKAELEHLGAEHQKLLEVAKSDIAKVYSQSEKELEMIIERKQRDAESKLEQLKNNASNNLKHTFTTLTKNLVDNYLKENKDKLPTDAEIATGLISPKPFKKKSSSKS